MFTGIIEEVGTVTALKAVPHGFKITVKTAQVLHGLNPGDSVSVDGVCLTITEVMKDSFNVSAVHESLSRSTLKDLRPSAKVNLERALSSDGRLGGHIVNGHVDGVGRIIKIRRIGDSEEMEISCSAQLLRYVVEKGSIALNGISLTVAAVTNSTVKVAVIPFTLQNTNLRTKDIGDELNIETDVLAKYVEKQNNMERASRIDEDFLRASGYKI